MSQNQNVPRDLEDSPVEKVRAFLLSLLSPQQLAQLDQILSGIDFNSGGAPAPVAMQAGGTEPGGKPAQDRRRFGRDALPGRGPTDADQNRPTGFDRRRMAGDDPAAFPGRPRPGSRDPFRQEVQMSNFAGDAALEAQTLRARLRRVAPIGSEGTLSQLRQACRAYGVPVGMAMDSTPYRTPADADAGLAAASRIGAESYMGRVTHEEPPARGADMAYDQGGGMNSVAAYFPDIAARWALNERSAFAVPVNPESRRADERNAARRSRGGGMPMAYDSRAAGRSSAPSIAQVFGSQFAATLDRIGHAR